MTRLTSLTDNDGEPHCSQGGEVYSYLSVDIYIERRAALCVWVTVHTSTSEIPFTPHHRWLSRNHWHVWNAFLIAKQHCCWSRTSHWIFHTNSSLVCPHSVGSLSADTASEDNDRLKINVACSLANYHLTTTSKVGGECSAKVSQKQQNDTVLSLAGMPVFWIL